MLTSQCRDNEEQKDAVMSKEGLVKVKVLDVTLDLIEFLKTEIVANSSKNDVLNSDLSVYLFTRCIKIYGKYRSNLNTRGSDSRISNCLLEIVSKCIIKFGSADLFEKSKKSETIFVLIEMVNSLVNFYDRESIQLLSKAKKDRASALASKKQSLKAAPRTRMKTRMIFNLLETIDSQSKTGGSENEIMKWLTQTIECFIDYFLAGKGSIVVSKSLDSPVI